MSSAIQVYSGAKFDPLNPDVDMIDIGDIAHALSLHCRFGGHVIEFYSVAQHSALVASHVSPKSALTALLHDASEAYIMDVPSPLKNSLFGDAYREAEDQLMAAIARRFGVSWPVPADVKDADARMLATEYRDLMRHPGGAAEDALWSPWLSGIEPYVEVIKPLQPAAAELMFLKMFDLLGGVN